jgi:hypothetical protein
MEEDSETGTAKAFTFCVSPIPSYEEEKKASIFTMSDQVGIAADFPETGGIRVYWRLS